MSDLPVTKSLCIPASELRLSFSRSSGPGGQNVNKVETKVELRWNPGESAALSENDRSWLKKQLASRLTVTGDLVVVSNATRNQSRNRQDCRDKLAELLRSSLRRPSTRKATKPSKGAKRRRLEAKKRRSDIKKTRGRLSNDD